LTLSSTRNDRGDYEHDDGAYNNCGDYGHGNGCDDGHTDLAISVMTFVVILVMIVVGIMVRLMMVMVVMMFADEC
jgi:hypothetical protein